ncbi:type II secretion system protein [bacterium]|nr:type II secretion system protein [bacterium]
MRGYTLGEVVLAMALLLVFIVFLIGLFLRLFQSSTKGLDSSIALGIAESVLSQVNDASPSTWPTLMGNQGVINRDPRTTAEFVTECAFTQPSLPPDAVEMGDIYEVTVAVYWMDQSRSVGNRRDYGRQSVRLSRLVYVSNMK